MIEANKDYLNRMRDEAAELDARLDRIYDRIAIETDPTRHRLLEAQLDGMIDYQTALLARISYEELQAKVEAEKPRKAPTNAKVYYPLPFGAEVLRECIDAVYGPRKAGGDK